MNPRAQLLVDELARHRHQFEVFCRSLTPSDLSTGIPDSPWTVKDYIAHLATIDGLIAHGFQQLIGAAVAPVPDVPLVQPFDIDDWNAAAVLARREATAEELLNEAAEHRAHLVEVYSRLDDAQLDSMIPFGARRASGLHDAPVQLRAVLWAISVHDPSHTRDILRALPQYESVPFVREWLASAHEQDIAPEIASRRA